ncbi:MAG: Holliday junction resolvase RuvX [Clostridiales bacterium]|jgi:putative Holliday junction resolvase|nr:Holliday junction resolvase RuvX [Clostridiales bacterium]
MINKIMAIDFGDKRTGVAISDPLGIIAQPLDTIISDSAKIVATKVASLAKDSSVHTIVVGLPKNMDGTLGFRAQKTKTFAEILKTQLEIINHACKITFYDERLTTKQATSIMQECGINTKKGKSSVDVLSAVIILEDYLKSIG